MSLGKALAPQGKRGPGPQGEWDKMPTLGRPGATATGPQGKGLVALVLF